MINCYMSPPSLSVGKIVHGINFLLEEENLSIEFDRLSPQRRRRISPFGDWSIPPFRYSPVSLPIETSPFNPSTPSSFYPIHLAPFSHSYHPMHRIHSFQKFPFIFSPFWIFSLIYFGCHFPSFLLPPPMHPPRFQCTLSLLPQFMAQFPKGLLCPFFKVHFLAAPFLDASDILLFMTNLPHTLSHAPIAPSLSYCPCSLNHSLPLMTSQKKAPKNWTEFFTRVCTFHCGPKP